MDRSLRDTFAKYLKIEEFSNSLNTVKRGEEEDGKQGEEKGEE